ncbi:MAG: biotin--[acetyl-CoA-carboxylase] ligase [Bacteroidota bacterium]
MDTKFFGQDLFKLKSVDSTNRFAIELIPKIDPIEGAVVWAIEQAKGKGRNNNLWESEAGKNLTFSVILYPEFLKADQQFYLSKAISLGVKDYICQYSDDVKIKWPNDIYVNDKKIAGILIEISVMGDSINNCVAGIGLNVNQTIFKKNVPNPTSLKLLLKNEFDLDESLEKLCGFLEQRYLELANLNFNKIDNEYNANLFRLNELHSFEHKKNIFKAKILRVDNYGNILLEKTDNTVQSFDLSELSFVIKEKV